MNGSGIHNEEEQILEEVESENVFQDIGNDLLSYSNFAHAVSGATVSEVNL